MRLQNTYKTIHDWFFKPDGTETKLYKLIVPFIVPIFFTIWSLRLSYISLDNTDQMKVLTQTLANIDSINKSTKQLPESFNKLRNVIDSISSTTLQQQQKLERQYISLTNTYESLSLKQKEYLDKVGKIMSLTNSQLLELEKSYKKIDAQYERKANIKFVAHVKKINGRYFLQDFDLENSGNIEAEYEMLRFVLGTKTQLVDTSYSIPAFYRETHSPLLRGMDFFTLDLQITYPKRVTGNGGKINFAVPTPNYWLKREDIEIHYVFSYSNKYENERTQGLMSLIIDD